MEERRQYIGASDVAIICGLSKFKSATQLLMEKRGQHDGDAASHAAEWGTYMEDGVALLAQKKLDVKMKRVHKRLIHSKMPYFSALLDRKIVGQPEVDVEIKTLLRATYNAWADNENGVADHIYLQVQAQMACDKRLTKALVIAALQDARELKFHWIDRDEDTIATIEEEVEFFWQNCVLGTSPPRHRTKEDFKFDLFERRNTEIADHEAMDLLKELARLKKYKKSCEEEQGRLEDKLAERMGEVDELTDESENWLSRFRDMESSRLNVKRLREDHPELAKAYTETKVMRSLRLNSKAIHENITVVPKETDLPQVHTIN